MVQMCIRDRPNTPGCRRETSILSFFFLKTSNVPVRRLLRNPISIIDGPPFYPAHMPGVPCKMFRRIFYFKDFRSPQQDTASNLYIFQLICSCCQRCIQRYRSCLLYTSGIFISPVSRLSLFSAKVITQNISRDRFQPFLCF